MEENKTEPKNDYCNSLEYIYYQIQVQEVIYNGEKKKLNDLKAIAFKLKNAKFVVNNIPELYADDIYQTVIRISCYVSDVTIEQLTSGNRKREVTNAVKIISLLCDKYSLIYETMGALIKRDHSTISTGCKTANIFLNFQSDPKNKLFAECYEYLLQNYNKFDFIWTSPPCQSHSRMMKATRHSNKKYPDMSLYQEIIFLQHFFKGKWIVENVKPYYEPLIKPTAILGRHCIWSNFSISNFEIKNLPNFIQDDTVAGTQRLKNWLGIHYEGNIYYKGNHSPGQVLRNCVHPDMGLHILNCAMGNFNKSFSPPSLFETEM